MDDPPGRPSAGITAAGLRRAALWLAPAWALGAALRLWGLPRQVLVGDEVHAVVSAVGLTLPEILTTYRLADHCIPLASYFRLLVESGPGLSELPARLPAVLSGLVLLIALPLAGSRRPLPGDRRRGAVLAWLVAMSPVLVYYSRIARPYSVVALFAPVAAGAFWRWWRGGSHGWAVVYVGSAAAAAWFHLGTAPFVALPLAYGTGEVVLRRLRGGREGGGRGPISLLVVGGALAAGVAAFLLPAWSTFRRLLRVKASGRAPDLETLGDVLLLQAGTGWALLAALFWGLAVLGLVSLLRRRPGLGVYAVLLVAVQWGAIAVVLRPASVALPLVLNRYVLPTLPVILLWVAEGILAIWDACRRRGLDAAGAGAAVLVLGALAVGNPYAADPRFRLGPFVATNQALIPYEPPPRLPPEAVSGVYRFLAREPGGGAVVEVGAETAAWMLRPTTALARLHGRPVVLASSDPWVADPRLALRTVVPAEPAAICRTGARFAVLQLDRPRLLKIERDYREAGEGGKGLPLPGPTRPRHPVVAEARELAGELRTAWGEPHLVSDDVLLWDLARVDLESTGCSPRP